MAQWQISSAKIAELHQRTWRKTQHECKAALNKNGKTWQRMQKGKTEGDTMCYIYIYDIIYIYLFNIYNIIYIYIIHIFLSTGDHVGSHPIPIWLAVSMATVLAFHRMALWGPHEGRSYSWRSQPTSGLITSNGTWVVSENEVYTPQIWALGTYHD